VAATISSFQIYSSPPRPASKNKLIVKYMLLNAAHLLTPIGVRMMLLDFGVASISAEMSLWRLREFSVMHSREEQKNMRSHLLLVRFGPFQRGSLVYSLFAAVEMCWEVRVTTTEGERAADGFGGERAIFLMSLASVAVGTAVLG
jgi:hypothetical protein